MSNKATAEVARNNIASVAISARVEVEDSFTSLVAFAVSNVDRSAEFISLPYVITFQKTERILLLM